MFFLQCYGDHRDLHSFPTRRSSDLSAPPPDCSKAKWPIPAAASQSFSTASPFRNKISRADFSSARPTAAECGWKDRKSTRLNSSHVEISYAVFCLKKKKYQYTVIDL